METKSEPELYDYGIQNERSDIRAHVCPRVQRLYVFPTVEGQKAVASGAWPIRPAYQNGVVGPTAIGYLVPPFAIKKCISLEVNPAAWVTINLQESDDTSLKGKKAVELVKQMILSGMFPLPYSLKEVNADLTKTIQINGDDIIVNLGAHQVHIQVKCDFGGGDPRLGGTGNLYLQVAERNPLKKI